ncbi:MULTISPECIES: HlyD family secretion protein [Myroides]|uniref:HlyD family efflux transporter periplasmic adaptor subunit n=1 Tax=Myroides albus TaxID=2562892 RepID=A0A6I3LNZ0_9FLAO|nr:MULTISPECIES: HlyD family secretion protein [Myroides]MTG97695.1 HlyD family efflux transporter periplasmic adaptor subunit [Myroides albus]MVX34645.1 HlyD family efflux transporter periplasmic adaptor subunit [Myroides sp. LoEW2-1]UVD78759.1 efflux RND transporter periplasmic adaptor subunit [Myroides albus]
MKNKAISALIGVVAVVLIVVISIWFMTGDKDSYIQGQVEATQINVASKIPGRIDAIYVKEGDKVKSGQVLLQISTPEIDAKLAQAESVQKAAQALDAKATKGAREEEIQAAYNMWQQAKIGAELAAKTYTRVENLFNEKVLPAQKKDEAYTQYKAAQEVEKAAHSQYRMATNGARVEDKQAALAKVHQAMAAVQEVQILKGEGEVKAPQSGEVLTIMPNKGEIVNSGYPIVNLVDLDDVWVYFNIKENLMPYFKMGAKLHASVPALGNQEIELEVKYIAAQADYATWSATKTKGEFDMKTFLIKAYPVKKVDGLRPGMSALVLEKSLK